MLLKSPSHDIAKIRNNLLDPLSSIMIEDKKLSEEEFQNRFDELITWISNNLSSYRKAATQEKKPPSSEKEVKKAEESQTKDTKAPLAAGFQNSSGTKPAASELRETNANESGATGQNSAAVKKTTPIAAGELKKIINRTEPPKEPKKSIIDRIVKKKKDIEEPPLIKKIKLNEGEAQNVEASIRRGPPQKPAPPRSKEPASTSFEGVNENVDAERNGEGAPHSEGDILAITKKIRCRFWPQCTRGDACSYHHPSQQCKNFPRCTFKDQCLYIHPTIPCKFGIHCARVDCAYAHPNPAFYQKSYKPRFKSYSKPWRGGRPYVPRGANQQGDEPDAGAPHPKEGNAEQ
eukprot:TRINITY_DN931_c0_g1_i35.p1 TRINITY_DN931_c0_g1~~TRINITY_DN931_c0_g1_i35.p1  ORF type:complete len:347 (+),score=69.70 TRINITY_DN931_c0_g1_i35:313-1353(+)